MHKTYKVVIHYSGFLEMSKEGIMMGKDRQERKLRKSDKVELDRDQDLKYGGATKLEGPEEARKRQR